ncbi:RagB/SusD family nutrient uptake outer membrane protein [Bacteroidota bacterium]
MRKIFVLLLTTIITIQSCKKVFYGGDVDIYRISDEENMEIALNGMYNRLAVLIQEHYAYQIINGDDITYFGYDNRIFNHNPYASIDNEGHFIFTDSIFYIDFTSPYSSSYVHYQIWQHIYNTIISANNIISQYEKNELDSRFVPMVGEAYLVRAYCFLRLVRVFGKGPLVSGVDVDYELGYSSPKEIYSLIETDLKNAIKILPDNNITARVSYVTPHRGTAKALLAQVYLEMAGFPLKDDEKYKLAANLSKDVIDSADYFGYRLLDDYANVWDRNDNANEESVFSIFYNPVSLYTILRLNSQDFIGGGRAEETSIYVPQPVKSYQSLDMNYFNDRGLIVENAFYNNYPRSYRRDITFMNHLEGYFYKKTWIYQEDTHIITDSIYFNHYYDTIDFGDNIAYLKHYILRIRDFPPVGAYRDINTTNYADKANEDNTSLYIFRFPHVLLTYAEAKARSNDIDASAYEAVNMVRRRANKVDIYSSSAYDLTPGLSPEQFADSVVQERAWEFCGELEGRWYDLLRLEMVDQLPELRDPDEKGPPEYPITEDDLYFPIPEEAAVWF